MSHQDFDTPAPPKVPSSKYEASKRGAKFWLIIVALCVALFPSALDFTGLATALPVIADDLDASCISYTTLSNRPVAS